MTEHEHTRKDIPEKKSAQDEVARKAYATFAGPPPGFATTIQRRFSLRAKEPAPFPGQVRL
jgi:hypothetical protein